MPLTTAQIKRLLTPVRPDRVESTRGQTYLPQFEARAELSRIFGPGNWDSHVHDVHLVYEDEDERDGGKVYWKVCYRAACTLTIRDYEGNQVCQYTEYHVEESAPQPSRGEAHALAMTSVESYALRRACINLGDALGLHLYKNGQMSSLVKGTLLINDDPESPLYEPRQPAPQQDLTDEQRRVLTASLGAQIESIENRGADLASEPETSGGPSGTYAGQ